jgi:hypothetical protein
VKVRILDYAQVRLSAFINKIKTYQHAVLGGQHPPVGCSLVPINQQGVELSVEELVGRNVGLQ